MSKKTKTRSRQVVLGLQASQSPLVSATYNIQSTRRAAANHTATWVFWVYLLAIATIEALTLLYHVWAGLVLHTLLLVILTLHSGLGRNDSARKLSLTLTLVPLIRLLSLSLPMLRLPLSSWYLLISLPMLLATWVVVQQTGLPRQVLGLHSPRKVFHVMMMSGGLGLGALKYLVFQPLPLAEPFTETRLLWLYLLLIFLAGFTEEVIFRGLIQAAAWPVMGHRALLYSAAVFAVLHIGYLSVPVVLFAFFVGLLFGQIVRWSGSILGVALLHSTIDLTQVMVLPSALHIDTAINPMAAWLFSLSMITPGVILLLLALMTAGLAIVLMVLGYLSALP